MVRWDPIIPQPLGPHCHLSLNDLIVPLFVPEQAPSIEKTKTLMMNGAGNFNKQYFLNRKLLQWNAIFYFILFKTSFHGIQ